MADLPASVRLETGRGGLPVLLVESPASRAEIYLHGATVTGWTPAGQDPVLWVSSASRFTGDAAIRGGVPICFPWFGARAGHPESPSHGFARLSDWSLLGAEDDGEDVIVRLGLTSDDAIGASAWPHPFEAVYTVVVGSRLSLALQVTNLGETAILFEEALHSYFDVPDIRDTEVTGLEGAAFYDRLGGPDPVPGEPGPVRFGGPTDRIYLGTSATTTIRGVRASRSTAPTASSTGSTCEQGRSVRITKDGSEATVVWNPWIDNARAMADLGDDEWQAMVCVEVCNIRDAAVRLAPGERHTMVASIELAPNDDPSLPASGGRVPGSLPLDPTADPSKDL